MSWKTLFIIFVLISLSLFFFSNNEIDPDLWGHLKFGEDIYEKHEIPRYDIYSYSSYGTKWTDHEWLSELLFFIVFKFTKGAGLIIFKVILGFIITLLIFISVSGRTESVILKLLFILIPLSVMDYGFATRPQIFTYLFFTTFVFFIDKFEETSKAQWLYSLPFISLGWCNLHGGFIVGVGILLLYLLFRAFKKGVTRELAIISILTIAATFINPYGKDLWVFLFKNLFVPRPYIHEWQKVKFSSLYLDYFAILSFAVIGILFSKSKRSLYEVSTLFIAFLVSFRHNRHIVLFAILTAIYIPKYINSFMKDRLIRFEKRLPRQKALIYVLSLCLCLFLMAQVGGNRMRLRIKIPEDLYPIDAIGFMKDNRIGGNIFPYFNWAQMCIRELSSTNKVFFDGRYETVYSNDLIREYFDILYGKKDYKDYLKSFPETDIMFLHRNNPLAHELIRDKEWVLVYTSQTAWIFLKDNEKNRSVIKDFKDNNLIYKSPKPPFYL